MGQLLKKEDIHANFVKVNGDTRINIKLKSGEETEINGQGPTILPEHQDELMNKIQAFNQEDILILAGSIQPSISAHFYNRMVETVKQNDVKVVVDTSIYFQLFKVTIPYVQVKEWYKIKQPEEPYVFRGYN